MGSCGPRGSRRAESAEEACEEGAGLGWRCSAVPRSPCCKVRTHVSCKTSTRDTLTAAHAPRDLRDGVILDVRFGVVGGCDSSSDGRTALVDATGSAPVLPLRSLRPPAVRVRVC